MSLFNKTLSIIKYHLRNILSSLGKRLALTRGSFGTKAKNKKKSLRYKYSETYPQL